LKVWQVRLVDAAAGPPSPGELAGTMVGTGSNPIELVEVQPEGKARQEATAWVRGARLEPGERLGA
jgi:methionyl-tRNA formyltransferase